MRLIIGVLAFAMICAALPPIASADAPADSVALAAWFDEAPVFAGKKGGPGMLAKIIAEAIKEAGAKIEGDNEVTKFIVDGTGHEVVQIGELNLNINIGDIMIDESERESGGSEEVAMRLLDIIGSRMEKMGGHPGMPPGHPEEFFHGEGFHHPEMDGFRPELMELMMMIPPDVDPGFVEFIFHVGALAWEHPRMREHLEGLVERVERMGEEGRRDGDRGGRDRHKDDNRPRGRH